jgi:hypothetical protein
VLFVHAVPILIGLLVGLLLGLVAWGLLRVLASEAKGGITGDGDGLILSLLALAAFSLGAFLAYLLLSFRF